MKERYKSSPTKYILPSIITALIIVFLFNPIHTILTKWSSINVLTSENIVGDGRIKSTQNQASEDSNSAILTEEYMLNPLGELEMRPLISQSSDTMGIISDFGEDLPEDNVFKIPLHHPIDVRHQYILTYKVKGVQGSESTRKSINEHAVYGGYMLKSSKDWNVVKEVLDARQLKKGVNTIRFDKDIKAFPYEVKDVSITTHRHKIEAEKIIFNPSIINSSYAGQFYLQGFTYNEKISRITCGNKVIPVVEGSIEAFVKLDDLCINNGEVELSYQLDRKTITQKIPLSNALSKASMQIPIAKAAISKDNPIRTYQNIEYHTASMELLVPSNLDIEEKIIISEARKVDVAPLGPGIINVTKGKSTYRCLPHGMQFEAPVTLKIPYDDALIPKGYSIKDIQTLYFDELKAKWTPVQIDSIDIPNQIVYAITDHFSDYINGIIQVPESPSTSEFTPTMMSDIKAAEPMANLNIMNAPSVSQKGNANTGFPIQLPPGRLGVQPQLGLNYSSDAGSSWTGYGWSMSLPAISVDTRWGSPFFDETNETEIYMLNGQQLIYDNGFLPNRHEMEDGFCTTPPRARTGSNETPLRFHERKLGSFARIERYGNDPINYYWVVTEANGMKHWYGNPPGIDGEEVKNAKGISYWPIVKSEDINGNNILYDYNNATNFPYIREIKYTGHGNTAGKYLVSFLMYPESFGIRKDKVITGRLGVIQEDRRLLKSIEVKYDGNLIRAYDLKYQEIRDLDEANNPDAVDCSDGVGRFHKTLLSSIADRTSDLSEDTLVHEFYYYDDTKQGLFSSVFDTVMIDCDEELPCLDTADNDLDGIPNCDDNCPDVWNPNQNNDCLDENPCGMDDADEDGIYDLCDNCIEDGNMDQTDSDNDGVGDACDNCDDDANAGQINSDNDSFGDACDNCDYVDNEDQLDDDEDGIGDACDLCNEDPNPNAQDSDGDELYGLCDNCPNMYNPDQDDYDLDGIGNECDNCIYTPNEDQLDDDGDGIGNACDDYVISSCEDGTVLLSASVVGNDGSAELIVPAGVSEIIVLFNPKCNPQTFEIRHNDVPVVYTDMISTTNCSSCPSNGINLSGMTIGHPLQGMITGSGTYNGSNNAKFVLTGVMEGDKVKYIVGHPVCTSSSSWNISITCNNPNSVILPQIEDLVQDDYSDEIATFLPKTEYSIYKISTAPADQLEYTFINLQGKKVIKKIGETKSGLTPSFIAKTNSVSVSSSSDYSVIKLNDYYTRKQKTEIRLAQKRQSTSAVQADSEKDSRSSFATNDGTYNEMSNSFVPDDCTFYSSVDVLSTLYPQTDQYFSPLGTTKSINSSAGGSLGGGFSIFVPFAKFKGNLGSVQGALNTNIGHSYTLVSNTDIDGDGLQDLILRHAEGHFRYRKHIVTRSIDIDGNEKIQHSYGPLENLLFDSNMGLDIADLELGYSESTNIMDANVTGTLALGPVGIHLGENKSTTVNENKVFFTDGNGDGLMDISYNGVVLFNYLNEDGIPTFTTSSEPTPNMIVTGFVESEENLVPDVVQELEAKLPDFDVVKVWRAPADGHIIINNLELLPEPDALVSIETDVNKYYSRVGDPSVLTGTCRLYDGDLESISPTINSLPAEQDLLDCKIYNTTDPCTLDSDMDGINDCIDPCPYPESHPNYDPDCEPCPENITVTQNVLDQEVDAEEVELNLTAINTIEQGGEAIYTAENQIALDENFTVNGELLAYIGPCGEGDDIVFDDDNNGTPGATSTIRVQKGQNLYFRTHSKDPYDEVQWDPEVVYTDVIGIPIDADNLTDNDGQPYYKNRYSKDFVITGESRDIIPSSTESNAGTDVVISWPSLEVGGLSDDVTFIINKLTTFHKVVETDLEVNGKKVKILEPDNSVDIKLLQTIQAGSSGPIEVSPGVTTINDNATYVPASTPTPTYNQIQGMNVGDRVGEEFTSYEFKVISASNIDWESINWHPLLEYSYTETRALDIEGYSDEVVIEESFYPIVEKDVFTLHREEFDINARPEFGFNNVRLKPQQLENVLYFTFNKKVVKDLMCPDVDDGQGNTVEGKDAGWCVGNLTAVIKQNGKAIGHQNIELRHDKDGNLDIDHIVIPVNSESDRSITVEIYADGEYLSTEAMKYMQSIPHTITNDDKDDFIGFISSREGKYNPKKSYVTGLKTRDCNLYIKSKDLYGPMYRNWGQFFYNPKADVHATPVDNFGKLINTQEKLNYPNLSSDDVKDVVAQLDNIAMMSEVDDQDLDGAIEDYSLGDPKAVVDDLQTKLDFENTPFFGAIPYKQKIQGENELTFIEKWRGLTTSNFARKLSARAMNLKASITNTIEEIPGPIEIDGDEFKGAFSLSRYSLQSDSSKSLPSIIPLLSGNRSKSGNVTLTDYTDINGDRYPDILTTDRYLTTLGTGGLSSAVQFGLGDLGEGKGGNFGLGASGELDFPKESTVGFSISGNMSTGSNKTTITWLDINGDGLSDKLTTTENTGGQVTGQTVELNEGQGPSYSGAPISGNVIPSSSRNVSYSFGGGIALTHGESFQAGLSTGRSTNSSLRQLIDINGDGLPDNAYALDLTTLAGIKSLIENGIGALNDLSVDYNTGVDFATDANVVSTLPDVALLWNSKSTTNTNNLGITQPIGIIPIPLFFFTIYIKAQIGIHGSIKNTTYSNTKKTFMDFDGDGFPDYVEYDGDNAVKVRHSQIRRTNKLKKVVTPIGAEFAIDYEVIRSTYDCPSAKWVMSKVKSVDTKNINQLSGLETSEAEGPGENTIYYTYSNPKQDRREREFLGFETVRSIQMDAVDDVIQADIANFEGHIFSQNIQYFHNQSYYLQGKSTETYSIEGSVALQEDGTPVLPIPVAQTYSKVTNKYKLRGYTPSGDDWLVDWSMNGDRALDYDVDGTLGLGSAFCFMDSTINETYENGVGPLSLIQSFEYDDWGRVAKMNHNSGEYTSEINYHSHGNAFLNHNIVSIPKDIIVKDGVIVKRHRATDNIDDKGRAQQIKVHLEDGQIALTDLSFEDIYGHIDSITYPQNEEGDRRITTYGYNDAESTYPTDITTFLPSTEERFKSNTSYNLDFGLPEVTTDVHGAMSTYDYDSRGRPIVIIGPKESNYTIKFSYEPLGGVNGGKGYATTEHFNHFDPTNPIRTVTIANGFGQAIQVKKDIALNGSSVDHVSISGPVLTDLYGRPIKQFLPTHSTFSTDFVDVLSDYYATTIYDDITKRPHQILDAANNPTFIDYDIEGEYMVTHTKIRQKVDGNDMPVFVESKEYKDVNGRVEKQINYTDQGDITTLFNFDGIGQMTSYIADDGYETSFDYDMGGRTIYRDHPDAGEEWYTYDHLSNLLTKASGIGLLTSKYDEMGRLLEFRHPNYQNGFESINNVKYTYYPQDYNAPNDNSGRLQRIDEATGYRTFQYGNMGEVTEEVRVIATPNTPTYKFTTSYDYDSWGRLKSMTYPDMEMLTYDYDRGGNLISITGDANYITDIHYDHFEQKTYCAYGNGTSSSYTYENDLRRLQTHQTQLSSGNKILDNLYGYDNVGNIDSIGNMASIQNDLGGKYNHYYSYDRMNRLVGASGSWNDGINDPMNGNDYTANYTHNIGYDDEELGRMTYKSQEVNVNGTFNNDLSSWFTGGLSYLYGNDDHPRAVTGIGHAPSFSSITYDANGNMTSNTGNINHSDSYMYWNTDNLMRGIKVDNYLVQHYVYDAEGQRVLKAKGDITTAGTQNNITTSAELSPYTIYPSGNITISPTGRYTKHYYSGSERIISRLSGVHDDFVTTTEDLSGLMQLYTEGELAQLESDLEVDTLKLGMAVVTNENCLQYPVGSEERKQCLCEQDPTNCPDDVLYYFHSDHLGSSSVLTDADGEPYQFFVYLPWGEVMAQQKVAQFSTPYQFNGKELDSETGLYNYGARYYDPSLSVWTGVDPLADKFPGWNSYNYTLNNPINMIDPDGRAAMDVDDDIILNNKGEEIYRVINDKPNRFFTEISTCDANGESCTELIEVHSPQTLSGDPKAQNPWDGNLENLDVEVLNSEIQNDVDEILNEHGNKYSAAFNESQPHGKIDYMRDVTDGAIYNVNGVYYNSHETLNLKWGMAMSKLGFSKFTAGFAANMYHMYAWEKDNWTDGNRYTKVGPVNEANHLTAIWKGQSLAK